LADRTDEVMGIPAVSALRKVAELADRIEQLDEWLKNGLIDRKEYDELKRRYREEFK